MDVKFLSFLKIFLTFFSLNQAKLPLIYPKNGTTYKYIIGFGVPWDDLVVETISSGIVWRFHFRLPATVDQLKHRTTTKLGRNLAQGSQKAIPYLWDDIVDPGNIKPLSDLHSYTLSSYRWGVYKSLEGLAGRMGLNGRDCVLKSICETAEDPLHFGNGLWAELAHVLLTPSSSVDKLSQHSDNDYYYAEHMGRSGAGCENLFQNCPRSLLDHFTNFYKLTNDLMKIW